MTSRALGQGEDHGVNQPPVPGRERVSGGITSLNATDGLFLRAEHLEVMQTYARELSLALGVASGGGVVYGFEVALNDAKTALNVQPGLALSAIGRPLRSTTAAVVSLPRDDLPGIDSNPNRFWVVEVDHASWNFGTENVYGSLCDEPCAGSGSTLQPWTAEGVKVSLRADDDIPNLGNVREVTRRRNWLASKYYERERGQEAPWLGSIHSIREWTRGIGPTVRSAVPIAVIQYVDGTWILDVWTARRDIGGPPADNAWRGRLGMRPWNVFLAQMLQFQDQLSSGLASKPLVVEPGVPHDVHIAVQRVVANAGKRASPAIKQLDQAVKQHELTSEAPSLRDHGFEELPPAGFLPAVNTGKGLRPWLERLFGEGVNLRICHVQDDYVSGAVEQAQHLNRIPLTPPEGAGKVNVDILVPDVADLTGPRIQNYRWVAFVRRREAECEATPTQPDPRYDEVDVYVVAGSTQTVEQIGTGGVPESRTPLPKLTYPADSWDYPGSDVAFKVLSRRQRPVAIVAIASADDRRPIAALRATLFAASLDVGAAWPAVSSIVRAGEAEAIIIVTPAGPG